MTVSTAPLPAGRTDNRITQKQLDYLGEAIRLRLVQEQNITDTRRAKKRGERIVYIADSSVFYFYINTFAPKEYNRALALPQVTTLLHDGLAPEDKRRAKRRSISTAVITAEYLFSGHLPGQDNFPLYITNEHAEEFQRRVSEILQDINTTAKVLSESRKTELSRRAGGLARRLTNLAKAGDLETSAQAKKLMDILDVDLPGLVSEFELAEVDRAVNLLHLMEGDVARPLRLAPGIDRSLLDRPPDPERVQYWSRLLSSFSPLELAWDDERQDLGSARTKNQAADAKVLARLEEINTDCEERQLNTRFVLVTTSAAMLSASAFHMHDKKLPLSANFVRSLIQYVPLLNFSDMPNFVKGDHASARLRDSLDGLFQWKRISDDRGWAKFLAELDIFLRGLNRLKRGIDQEQAADRLNEEQKRALFALRQERMDAVFRSVDVAGFETSLRNISSLWGEMVENSIGLNARLLLEHYSRHLGKVEEGLASLNAQSSVRTGLSDSYEQRQFNLTDELSRIHLRMAARLMMANPRSPSRRLAETVRGARPSLYLGADDERSLMQIVDHLIANDNATAEEGLLDFTHRPHLGIAELNLAVATVALRIGLWDNAANFAHLSMTHAQERASLQESGSAQHIKSLNLAAEAEWLAGAARRVGAVHHLRETKSWRATVRHMMPQAQRYQEHAGEVFATHGDFLGQARSMAEIAMIGANEAIAEALAKREVTTDQLNACRIAGKEAHILANGLLARQVEADGPRVVTHRTRLLAEMGLVLTSLLAWVLDVQDQIAEIPDMAGFLDTAETDMDSIGRDTFSSWPLFIRALRLSQDGASVSAVKELRVAWVALDKAARGQSTTASDLEVFFLEQVMTKLERVTT